MSSAMQHETTNILFKLITRTSYNATAPKATPQQEPVREGGFLLCAGCIARGYGLKQFDVPDVKLLLICAVVVLACFVLVVVWKSKREGGPMVVQQRPMPPLKGSLGAPERRVDVKLGREILHLLEAGRRAEAVVLVREQTGWGVEEAEAAVVRLENLMKRVGL
jgi:hypothetical protein